MSVYICAIPARSFYRLPSYGLKGETILGQPNQIHPLGVTQIPFSIFVDYVQGLADSTFRLGAVIAHHGAFSPLFRLFILCFFLHFFSILPGRMLTICCDIIATPSPTKSLNSCVATRSRNTFSICLRKFLARETHFDFKDTHSSRFVPILTQMIDILVRSDRACSRC